MGCGRTAYYHVTTFGRLATIARRGLRPGAQSRGWWTDDLLTHSATALFLIDADVAPKRNDWWRSPIDFWYGIVADHAYDELPSEGVAVIPVVLRVWVSAKHPIYEDTEGDVGALLTPKAVLPTCIDVWTGAEWVSIKSWRRVDPNLALSAFDEIAGSSRGDEFSMLAPAPKNI